MRKIRTAIVTSIVAIIAVLIATAFLPASAGVGVQVYRTSKSGSYRSNVSHAGDTSDCCCIGAALGTLGYGAKLCYLP